MAGHMALAMFWCNTWNGQQGGIQQILLQQKSSYRNNLSGINSISDEFGQESNNDDNISGLQK